MQTVVDGLLTNYRLQGKGPLLLFIHGWGDSSQGSLDLQAHLARWFTVLAPDLPGFGKTQAPPTSGWDLDDFADYLKNLLIKLDLEQPAVLMGHSNGGAIAVRAVGTDKIHPQKLILLAPSGIRASGSPKRMIIKALTRCGKTVTTILPDRAQEQLRRKLYNVIGSELLLVDGMQETFKKVIAQDVQPDLVRIAVPTLLIFAAEDKAVPMSMAAQYHKLMPQASFHMIQKAGHFVHLDETQHVNALIEEFLHEE